MEFRLLGSLDVAERDRSLPLGGSKQRALLAMLLLHANARGLDRAADRRAVGRSRRRRRRPRALQVLRLAAAQGARGRAAGDARAPGYVLRVDPAELDLARFERLLADARRARPIRSAAAARLREALALWRGPPLADLADEPFAQPRSRGWRSCALAALEERIDAELATGRHAELVGELRGAGRPSIRCASGCARQLMLALYRSRPPGRGARGLPRTRAARWSTSSGSSRAARLRELERAILAQDPALDAGRRAIRAPARRDGGGRVRRPRARAGGAARRRSTTRSPAAGGSSCSPASRASARAGSPRSSPGARTARGARVLVGRCWEAGGAPGLLAVGAGAARLRRATASPTRCARSSAAGAADLAQLAAGAARARPRPAASRRRSSPRARASACSRRAREFLRSAAARAEPLVLVLDDLHAADEPSLLLLRFLARELGRQPAARRRRVPRRRPDAAATPLSRDARRARARAGDAPDRARRAERGRGRATTSSCDRASTPAPALVAAIHDETEGNPLFVGEIVRLLAAEGARRGGRRDLRIPQGVRDVIGRRLAHLSARVPRPARARVGARPRVRARRARAAERRSPRTSCSTRSTRRWPRASSPTSRAPGRLRFAHALIRDTLYDELTPARRLELHRRAGEALEAVYAADLEPHLAELAHHFAAAGGRRATRRSTTPARRRPRRRRCSPTRRRSRLYEMALRARARRRRSTRCELLLALGDAQARAGRHAGGQAGVPRRRRARRRLGLAEQPRARRARVRRAARLGRARDDERLVPLLEGALAALGDEDSRAARPAARPPRRRRCATQPLAAERRHALSAEALAMARRIGDPATLAYALAGYIAAHHSPEHTRRRSSSRPS